MSVDYMTLAWRTELQAGPRLVLLAICDNANDDQRVGDEIAFHGFCPFLAVDRNRLTFMPGARRPRLQPRESRPEYVAGVAGW